MSMASEVGTRVKRSDSPELPRRPRALVVDDADGMRAYLATLFETRGFDVDTCDDGRHALSLLESGADPDVVLLDVMMPGADGLSTLARIRERWPELPVLMVSVVGKASTIVQAMQLGAADYLTKPFEESELDAALDRLGLHSSSPARPTDGRGAAMGTAQTVWVSPAMREIRAVIEQIGDTDVTVLIQGESGAGKEIVARAAHELSPRRKRPFVKVNCAALPEELLESELFGYERGAFTGAHQRKPGKFEQANRGTIFLDEIGEMSPPLQAKLLQVLQDSSFHRLGGNDEVAVDVRVVCATNRRLEEMVQEGSFRDDLFFRLNVVSVSLAPLRERREEIARLVATFGQRFAARYGRPHADFSERLMKALHTYSFPGNVRELENMIKRIIVLETEEPILQEISGHQRGERGASRLRELIEEIEATAGEVPLREVGRRAALEAERETIDRVLRHTQWNRKQAARLLQVSYKTLLQKIRDCELQPD